MMPVQIQVLEGHRAVRMRPGICGSASRRSSPSSMGNRR